MFVKSKSQYEEDTVIVFDTYKPARNAIKIVNSCKDNHFVIKDVDCIIFNATREMLKKNGYRIEILNLHNPHLSTFHYNPIEYLETDKDIAKFAETLLRETQTPDMNVDKEDDAIWKNAEVFKIKTIIKYLKNCRPKKVQNLHGILSLLKCLIVNNSMFEQIIGELNDEEITEKYEILKNFINKNGNAVFISIQSRLIMFALKNYAEITNDNTLDIQNLSDKRTRAAIFINFPSPENSYEDFDFLAAMLDIQI